MTGRTKTRLVWVIRGVLALLIVALAAVTFLPGIETNIWWIRFLSFPRLQFLIALLVLLLLSLVLPGRFRWLGIASTVLAAAALAFQCWVLWPWTPLAAAQVTAAESCPNGNGLRVLEANVQMTNEHDRRLLDEIAATKPDLVLAEEVDKWWHDEFEKLYAAYPYHSNQVQQNYYGITLLSKDPLVDPNVVYMANSRDPAIFTGVRLPSGITVGFYGIHPRPPTEGQSSAGRDAEIMDATVHMAAAGPGPKILAGDLNATPWSPVVRRLARIAHLNDPRIGRGWLPTWKANAMVLRWPLDNVLFTAPFSLSEFRVLAPFGSDHQPTLTTVCYDPAVADRQTPPARRSGDMAAAERAITAGQGRAAPSPPPKPAKQQPND